MLTPSTHAAWFRGTGGTGVSLADATPVSVPGTRRFPQDCPAGGCRPIGDDMVYVLAFLIAGCLVFAFCIAALIVGGRG